MNAYKSCLRLCCHGHLRQYTPLYCDELCLVHNAMSACKHRLRLCRADHRPIVCSLGWLLQLIGWLLAGCGSILTPLLLPAETAGVGAHLLATQGALSSLPTNTYCGVCCLSELSLCEVHVLEGADATCDWLKRQQAAAALARWAEVRCGEEVREEWSCGEAVRTVLGGRRSSGVSMFPTEHTKAHVRRDPER